MAWPISPPNASTIAWWPRQTPSVGTRGPSSRIDLDGDACVVRPPGTGGDDEPVGRERLGFLERDRVVPAHDDLGAELLEQVHEVVGEGVVVVDEENLHAYSFSASSSAASSAASLARHSRCSAAGSESATTPAPAWSRAIPSAITIVRRAMHVSIVPPGST